MAIQVTRIDIDSSNIDPFIKKTLMKAMGSIINKCEREYNARYSDQTMLMLYNRTQQFIKEIGDVVSAENLNPHTDLFGSPVNYNYFAQRRDF